MDLLGTFAAIITIWLNQPLQAVALPSDLRVDQGTDPGQQNNFYDQRLEAVRTLKDHYESCGTDTEKIMEQTNYMTVDSEKESMIWPSACN